VNFRWFTAIAFLASACAFAGDQPAWRAVVGYDPLQGRTACLLESAPVTVHDGQLMTPVRILYNGTAFLATTQSNIDLSYPNVGLQVDSAAPVAIERVYKDTNVIFEHDARLIKAHFIRGSMARLSLGFWPTWPKGEAVDAEFSLIGFSRAHEEFLACEQSGLLEVDTEEEAPR
jgi:hypothetical protein